MSERAEALADQFARLNDEAISFVQGLSEADWNACVPGEGRTVGVVVQHIALGYEAEVAGIRAIVEDSPLPTIYESRDALDEMNARHAEELRAGTKQQAIELLRRHGADAERFIRGLIDDDLERSRPLGLLAGRVFAVQQLVEFLLLRHARGHLAGIRSTIDSG